MKEIKINSNGIKQAVDYLVNKNEMLQDKIYKLENIIKELKERSLQYSEEIDRLLDIKEKVRECLYKNRVYIAGERNLAFEIEQILDKENNNE